jgi:acetoacetyl-CoA synthetase
MARPQYGTLMWEAPEDAKRNSTLAGYLSWLQETRELRFTSYHDLWAWSVSDLEGFWGSIWEYYGVGAHQSYTRVLSSREMPGARWFEGARLNYAEHIFRMASPDRPALLFRSETQPFRELSWASLRDQVASVAAGLKALGVRRGDRVAACLPTIPETLIGFLAAASMGAIWSSCSPESGVPGVVDRFRQIQPTVLLVTDGYQYQGRFFDKTGAATEIRDALPTLRATVLVRHAPGGSATGTIACVTPWEDLLATRAELTFDSLPFDHPLWVLYTSGSTGLPKPIVHGHGGILIEMLKAINLELNLKPGDRFFWHTTPGWSMWNFLVSSLLVGCTAVTYDGSPGWPDQQALWSLAAEGAVTCLGTSAAHIEACMKAGIEPGKSCDLSALSCVAVTGSAFAPEGFGWVYDTVKDDVWLLNGGGGTETCSAFAGGTILLPVRAGEIPGRALGADVRVFDAAGRSVVGQPGELVITQPMPSMPLYLWDDPAGQRYQDGYFTRYPGVWHHGDQAEITPAGSVILYGRSDAVLNRGGVRLGTAEVYRVLESLPEVVDSLIVGAELPGRGYIMPLFVVLRPGQALTSDLEGRIRAALRQQVSPHCVPDGVYVIPAVPRTGSGKKLEVPVREVLAGVPVRDAVDGASIANPASMAYFASFAKQLRSGGPPAGAAAMGARAEVAGDA